MSDPNQEPDPVAEQTAREKEAAEQAALPYQWRQTIGDVDISVPVPEGSRAKDLNITYTKDKITVGVKGMPPILEVGHHIHPSHTTVLLMC